MSENMNTWILISPEFAELGALLREGSQVQVPISGEIELGDCETMDDVRAALENIEADIGPLDNTARISWPGDAWLLTVDEIRK